MDDKHDPNGSVPIGTFTATSDDGTLEIPIEIVEDGYEERELAIAEPLDGSDPPRRQRVATLLGVPMPGSAASRAFGLESGFDRDPTKASRKEISNAVDDALDERPTTIYGYKRDAFADLERVIENRDADRTTDRRGEVIGVVGSESDTGTYRLEVHEVPESRKSPLPVLAPKQFVEARARDSRDLRDLKDGKTANEPIALPTAADKREPITKVVSADRAKELAASAVAARAERPAAVASASSASKSVEPPTLVNKPVTSLAPTEVKRATQVKREPASTIGYAMLAAVVLIGLGGWFLTRGTYKRDMDPAAQPTAAASIARPGDSANSMNGPKLDSAPTLQTAPTVAEGSASPSVAQPAVAQPGSPVEDVASGPKPVQNAVPGLPGTSKPRVAGKGVRKKTVAVAPAPTGPIDTPTRDDVLSGLDRVRSNVRACAEGRQGVAEVDLTIAKNGVVTNALVGGDFGGTPQGSCMARAVRKARFPQFTQDRYRVLFPYVL